MIPNSGPFLGIILPNSIWYGVYSDLPMMQKLKKKKKKGEYLISEGLLFVMTRFQHNPLNSILMGPHIEFQVGMMALSHRDFNAFFHFVIWQNQYNIVKLNKIKFFLKMPFFFFSYSHFCHFLLQALPDPRFHHKDKRTSATAIPLWQ